MPSGFLSKFGRDKTSPGAGSLKQQQQQQQQQQARPAARSPATSAFAQAQTAPPIHSSSIDSTSTSSPTVAGSSAGGSGSSASSSLIAGHMQQSSARTLSGILGGQEAVTTPGSNMSMQQRAQAEASAGVAMAGIPIVQVQGVQQYPNSAPQQQDQYSGARQMSVDMMDVSGLSLTGQVNDPVRQAADEAMRDKMRAAQLQAAQAQAAAEYAASQARVAALNAQASQAAYEQAQAQQLQQQQQAQAQQQADAARAQQHQQAGAQQHVPAISTPTVSTPTTASPSKQSQAAEVGYVLTSSGVKVPAVPSVRKTAGRYGLADFQIERTLGTGSFGRVHLVRSRHNGRFYAVKVLNKEKVVRMKQVEHTNSEREMLVRVRHPFLVNLWGTFGDLHNLYMVMDFVAGGELFSLLRKSQRFPNSVAKFYAAEVALALDYLHSLDIIYRDLKPENLLLGADGHVKVTDFGFAKLVPDITWTLCGTPDYLAPEVVQSKGYNKSVDWYALGVLIFEMLAGYPPFFTEDGNPMKLYEKIIAGKVRYPTYFDATAKELLKNLLVGDLSKRFGNLRSGAADIFLHPWFNEVDWEKLYRREIPAPYVPRIEGDGDASQFDRYAEADVSEYGKTGRGAHDHLFPEF